MSNKTELLRLLNRCQAVVHGEANLLHSWANIVKIGQAAQAEAARSRIEDDPAGSGTKVDDVVSRATALADAKVLRAPTEGDTSSVEAREERLTLRRLAPVLSLTSNAFGQLVAGSERNAQSAADEAADLLQQCT